MIVLPHTAIVQTVSMSKAPAIYCLCSLGASWRRKKYTLVPISMVYRTRFAHEDAKKILGRYQRSKGRQGVIERLNVKGSGEAADSIFSR